MVTVIIEGTSAKSNGNLRIAFSNLFSQQVSERNFKLILADDKGNSVKKFLQYHTQATESKALLIDLDGPASLGDKELRDRGLSGESYVYWMIQEMEAWFFSQPEVLQAYYGKDFNLGQFKNKSPEHITDPAGKLADLSSKTKKGKYHKVTHACDLLERLSLAKLRNDFKYMDELVKLMQ